MKTRNVYATRKAFIAAFCASAFSLAGYLHVHSWEFLLSFIGFGIGTIMGAFLQFIPFFSYNENFLIRANILKGLKGTEIIKWEDIVSFKSDDFVTVTVIRPKSGNLVPMTPFIIRDYYFVLAEMLDLSMKKNKNVTINELTFKLAEKGRNLNR